MIANIPFRGAAGQAEISYYYKSAASGNPCPINTAQLITKPVIIIDGIDYAAEREGGDIYGEYLGYRDGTGRKNNLGVELRDQGYDVVILDFPNLFAPVTIGPFSIGPFTTIGPFTYQVITRHSGADYMERNAYTLVKLIQQLNQQMKTANPASTEQLVVVGPSMGGQISRYALTYMEKRYKDPNDA